MESVKGIWQIIKENWVFLLVLSIGIVALYFNGMRGAFVSDDYATIPNNPTLSDFGKQTYDGLYISFSNTLIDSFFGHVDPTAYHVYNLITYVVVCIVIFVFLEVLFNNRYLSMLTTSLFAAHPIHVEGVTWISGKPYINSTLFVLASCTLTYLYFRTGIKKYLWPLIFTLPMAFGSDRVRSTSFILVMSLIILVFRDRFKVKVSWLKVTGIMVSAGVLLLLVLWPLIAFRINSVNSGYNSSESIFYSPLFQYPTAIAKYLQLLFYPVDLTLYHTMFVFPMWLNLAILMMYLVAIGFFWKYNKVMFFGLVFIILATSPSMAPVKVSWLVAERYVLMGSIGYCLVLAEIILGFRRIFKFGAPILLVAILVFYSVRTFIRNIDWQTNHNLWVNTCQVSPNSHNAWNNIGDDYDKLKDYPNAVKGFTQSTIVKPNYADAFHNRANIFFKMGRLDLARDSYLAALKFSPGLFQAYLSLTQIGLMEKNGEQAIKDATAATQVQPQNAQTWYVLGVVQSQVGRNDLAMESMKKALTVDPGYKPANDAMVQLSAGMTGR